MSNSKGTIIKFIIVISIVIRLFATILSMMNPTLHDMFVPFGFFNVLFVRAFLYSDTVSELLCIIMILLSMFEVPLLMISSVLIVIKRRILSLIGTGIYTTICLLDIVCCIISVTMLYEQFKIINLIINIVVLLILLLNCKTGDVRQGKTGDG